MRIRTVISGLAVATFLWGCTEMSGPRPVSRDTVATASATVEAVDMSSRTLRLRNDATGEPFEVVAGPEVRNLAQVRPGDTVEVGVYESIAVAMADPADTGEPMIAVAGARAPEGERPGGLAIVNTSEVVELVSYDRQSFFAELRTADGTIRRVTVPPQFRTFAEQRRPGDRILVGITDAVDIMVVPPAAS
jgi:hypothetical protein